MPDQSVVATDDLLGISCRVVPLDRPRTAAPHEALAQATQLADPFDGAETAALPRLPQGPTATANPLRGLDAASASAQVLDICQQIAPCDASSVLLIDTRERSLYFAVARGPLSAGLLNQRVPLEVGLAGACIRTRRSINLVDPVTDARFARTIADTVGHIPRAIVAVPVLHERRIFGVIELLDPSHTRAFSGDQEARLRRAARHLGQHLAALAGLINA
jgi:GAF domain-containing protein